MAFPDLNLKRKTYEVTKKGFPSLSIGVNASGDKQQKFYDYIISKETPNEPDPWIRTKSNAGGVGSSAFGEAQITKGLTLDAIRRPSRYGISKDERIFLGRLYAMQQKFLKYGGKDMKPGFERYDYGKKGSFTNDEIPMYRQVVKKIANRILTDNKGELEKAYRVWHYGSK